MKSPTVRSLLHGAKIDVLLKNKRGKVVTVLDTVTVESALGTLAQKKILSAPMLSQARIDDLSSTLAQDTAFSVCIV